MILSTNIIESSGAGFLSQFTCTTDADNNSIILSDFALKQSYMHDGIITINDNCAIDCTPQDVDVVYLVYVLKNNSNNTFEVLLDEVRQDGIDLKYQWTNDYSCVYQLANILVKTDGNVILTKFVVLDNSHD